MQYFIILDTESQRIVIITWGFAEPNSGIIRIWGIEVANLSKSTQKLIWTKLKQYPEVSSFAFSFSQGRSSYVIPPAEKLSFTFFDMFL